jgi:hypothetical protein
MSYVVIEIDRTVDPEVTTQVGEIIYLTFGGKRRRLRVEELQVDQSRLRLSCSQTRERSTKSSAAEGDV